MIIKSNQHPNSLLYPLVIMLTDVEPQGQDVLKGELSAGRTFW